MCSHSADDDGYIYLQSNLSWGSPLRRQPHPISPMDSSSASGSGSNTNHHKRTSASTIDLLVDDDCASQDFDSIDPLRPSSNCARSTDSDSDLDETDLDDILGVSQISAHFEDFLAAVSRRVNELAVQAKQASLSTHMQLRQNQIKAADEQIAQLRKVMNQCDDLDTELLKISHLSEIVSDYRARVARIDSALAQLAG